MDPSKIQAQARPLPNSMANQIQGLKKVAAANRNKTKSQMRESANAGNFTGERNGAYGTKDSHYADQRQNA